MRLREHVTLIPPVGDAVETVCHPMIARGSEIEQAGVRVEQGGIQLIIDQQSVTPQWDVDFRGRRYGVTAIVPYLKRRYPKRDVLICEALNV